MWVSRTLVCVYHMFERLMGCVFRRRGLWMIVVGLGFGFGVGLWSRRPRGLGWGRVVVGLWRLGLWGLLGRFGGWVWWLLGRLMGRLCGRGVGRVRLLGVWSLRWGSPSR